MTAPEIRDLLKARAAMWLAHAVTALDKGLPLEARFQAEVALELLDVLGIVQREDATPTPAPLGRKSGTGTPPEPWEPHDYVPMLDPPYGVCRLCGKSPSDARHAAPSVAP